MTTSTDPSNFFQTEAFHIDAARKRAKASNTAGQPVRLRSKLLAVAADATDPSAVFVAESAGTLRRLCLTDPATAAATAREYRGPAAPLTSIAQSATGTTVYAGCWDTHVWSWDARTATRARRFTGPSDFVKCVAAARTADGTQLLAAGSADAAVVVWDASTGARLHVLRGHARGVLDLAVQPIPGAADAIVLWSAGSDRSILRHRVGRDAATAVPFPAFSLADAGGETEVDDALLVHETSVNKLRFDAHSGALLTASSDKSAKSVVRGAGEEGGEVWRAAQTLPHPDFVRDALALSTAEGRLVATACRDEDVRIWDLEDEGGELEPVHVLRGHFDEVSGLAVARVRGADVLVSVSLDGTVRTWPASRAGLDRLALVVAEQERATAEGKGDGGEEEEGTKKKEQVLTEDEERELAELMEDDE